MILLQFLPVVTSSQHLVKHRSQPKQWIGEILNHSIFEKIHVACLYLDEEGSWYHIDTYQQIIIFALD